MDYFTSNPLTLVLVLLACVTGCCTAHAWTNPCSGDSAVQKEFASSLITHRRSPTVLKDAVRDVLSNVPTNIEILDSRLQILQNLYEETGRDDAIAGTGDVTLEELNINHIQRCRQIRNVHQSLSKVHELLLRSIVYLSLSLETEKQYTEQHHPNSDIEDEILSVKNELLDLLCVMDKIHAVKRFRKTTETDVDISRFLMGSNRMQKHSRDCALFNNVRLVLACARTLFNRM